MARRKKGSGSRTSPVQRRLLDREQLSVAGEASYIVSRAQSNDACVVTIGPLVFFSTVTGDAWVLDTEDHLALCLAQDGDARAFAIAETASSFSIEWAGHYRIEGDAFIFVGWSGQTRSILGYPATEILRAARRAR